MICLFIYLFQIKAQCGHQLANEKHCSLHTPDRNVELIQLISFAGSTWTLIWSSAHCWNNCENDGLEESQCSYWQSSVARWVYNISRK